VGLTRKFSNIFVFALARSRGLKFSDTRVSPDMKILLILNPPCVQRFALTAIASSGSVATISKHMHPFGAESITKPLKAIARRAPWDYRAPENLSIIREGRDGQKEREEKRKIRAYVQNRSAYINSHDGNWIKVAELFAGTLHTRVLARRNASRLSRDTMRSHSNATAQRKSFCSIEERIVVSMECRDSDGWKCYPITARVV